MTRRALAEESEAARAVLLHGEKSAIMTELQELAVRQGGVWATCRRGGAVNSKVAALFVEAGGVYFGRDDVDPWDITRDARKYAGPLPVVAHPPCQRWGSLGVANYARWGGEHNRPGNDGGCFASALESVRKFGGVLEHPRGSLAWQAFNLHVPQPNSWTPSSRRDNEWTCEVWQSAYGHKANKATWLLYVGSVLPPDLNWARVTGSHQIGFQDRRGKAKNKPTLSKREANATPTAFAELLIGIAKSARDGAR